MSRTTRVCHRCGSDVLWLFRSLNLKVCHQCHAALPWTLTPGQKPLIDSSRDRTA